MAITDHLPDIPHPPPGPQRLIPEPDVVGKFASSYVVTPHPNKTAVKCETAYFVWGNLHNTQKVPLIAVHGGPGMTRSCMLPFAHLFGDYGIPVVLYDQIGCGQSTRFKDRVGDGTFWTPELLVKQLESLIKHLNLMQFDILGHSWGGFLAGLWAVTRQPAGLRKFIVCNTPSDLRVLPSIADKLVTQMPVEIQEVFRKCRQAQRFESTDDKAVEMFFYAHHSCRLPQPYPKELLESLMAAADNNACGDTVIGSSPLIMNGTISKLSGLGNSLEKFTEAQCPGGILVVTGKYDLAAPETCSDWWTKPRTNVRHVNFELSSHFTMFEETEKLLEEIGAFLTDRA